MALRLVRPVLVVLAAGMLAASCAPQDADSSETDAPVAETQSAARTVDQADVEREPTTPVLADDIDPMGVITAAVLLRTGGDVDEALATGSFTRKDLDAARRGLEDGSLDHLFD